MNSMFPNNQVIEIFGEDLLWPGVDSNGKFTNGSFSDPLIKPSFIPAETLNLIIENIQSVILEAGLTPNTIEPDQLARALLTMLQKDDRYDLLDDYPVAASTVNINISVGGEQEIDGIPCTIGQMVFLKNQTDKRENGFWEVRLGEWNRYTGYTSTTPNIFNGKFILIKNGISNKGKVYYLLDDISVVDTTPLDFKEHKLLGVLIKVFESNEELPLATKSSLGGLLSSSEPGKLWINPDTGVATVNGYDHIWIKAHAYADQVEGYGRDLMLVELGYGIEEMTTQSLRNEAIAEVMAKIRIRMNNNSEIDGSGIPDVRGLAVGDWLDGLDLSGIAAPSGGSAPQAWNDTYKNNRILIAGFNSYKNSGDNFLSQNHIAAVTRHCIATGKMNPTDITTGGYVSTGMRTWLEGSSGDGSGIFATGLKAALGGNNPLLTRRNYFTGATIQDFVNQTVFLLSIREVFGDRIQEYRLQDNCISLHLPIYHKSTVYKVKRFNGVVMSWWLSAVAEANSTNFCDVRYGYSSHNIASLTQGISPAFLIK